MNDFYKIKQDLIQFWSNFDLCIEIGKRCIGKCRDKTFKLQLLIGYSKKQYHFKNRKSLEERRQDFLVLKKVKLKFKYPCFVCLNKSEARHHIIGLDNGGTNAKKNVIPICNNCHKEIHPWLKNDRCKL